MEKELPKNWVRTELGEITSKPQYGWTSKAGLDGDVKYLRTTDLSRGKVDWDLVPFCIDIPDDISKYQVEKDDILISRAGSVGLSYRIEESPEKAVFASYLIRFKPYINAKLIEYYLKSSDYWNAISDVSAGIAVQNINAPKLSGLKFPLPPFAEQNRIVEKLDRLFAQLEDIRTSMEKIPVLLKNFRQQVLTQAVTGKLTEEWREGKDLGNISNRQIADTLDFEVRELNGNNINSGRSKIKINSINFVRKNEINWSYYTVESLSIAIVDCLHETAKFSQIGYKIIDTNNINAFKINELKLRFVEYDIYKKWTSRLKPEYGDIVFTREGTIGNALMIPENDTYCIGQRTMIFRFTNLLEPRFCEYYLNSEPFKRQYKPFIKGVASQHLNIRDLRLLEMPIPSISEQQEIVSRVESLFTKADAIEEKYKNLKAKIETLPQTILHKAFKGELSEQLETDGDAKDLLEEIMELKRMK
ncbi:MAG: hypothetical protein GXO46_01780 [Chlorobi bacterium]|nr:hypothetical protein [Chlorobiota bacterium]